APGRREHHHLEGHGAPRPLRAGAGLRRGGPSGARHLRRRHPAGARRREPPGPEPRPRRRGRGAQRLWHPGRLVLGARRPGGGAGPRWPALRLHPRPAPARSRSGGRGAGARRRRARAATPGPVVRRHLPPRADRRPARPPPAGGGGRGRGRRRRLSRARGAPVSILSAAVLLFVVMDPIGNVPMFLVALREVEPGRRRRVVLRELVIALGVLLAFLVAGRHVLALFQISGPSLSIAGGLILFLIALRMIFRGEELAERPEGEPLVFPLAIPYIAGPS